MRLFAILHFFNDSFFLELLFVLITVSFLWYIFQVDTELSKELEQWNDMLKNDAVKLCQENNFITGFFEGSDNNCVVDAYELKVMTAFNRAIF